MVHSLSRRYPHTTSRAFLLMLACTLFTSGGQLLLKKGAQGIIPGQVFSYANLFVILGLAAYGVAAILMIASLRSGEVSSLPCFGRELCTYCPVISSFFLDR